ncbi:hypothetical protein GWI33_010500 [Rhynchophorus ferrugineus]|uniref:Uncharacterized protein n=1 Tax=Rhynchophorus ferrugineus TaxID=354439 RepID=A0A834IT33_RHYFE|nr:hypothetical protein GWI33_010500 [Rhynchophorus ferrugineus]
MQVIGAGARAPSNQRLSRRRSGSTVLVQNQAGRLRRRRMPLKRVRVFVQPDRRADRYSWKSVPVNVPE